LPLPTTRARWSQATPTTLGAYVPLRRILLVSQKSTPSATVRTAIQVVAVFLGVVLGFTTSVVAWILDLGYTLSYNSLKKKMGVSV